MVRGRRRAERIVSSLNLIPQTWSYGGVPFGVGRVELVGTLPEYRRRGLMRRQMDEVHRWCADLGHPVQIITGIANFYRQFGYEQGLSMTGGPGRRTATASRAWPWGAASPSRVRPATRGGRRIPGRAGGAGPRPARCSASPATPPCGATRSPGCSAGHALARLVRVVEAGPGAAGPLGERVGYVVHDPARAPTVSVMAYELLPGLSWLAVTPSVLRCIEAYGDGAGAPGAAGRG